MLTRRHIRVKVMQAIYALALSKEGSLESQQKFLNQSIAQTFTLYLLILSLFRELHQLASEHVKKGIKKYLKQAGETTPLRFSENQVLQQIAGNEKLKEALKKRKDAEREALKERRERLLERVAEIDKQLE